MYWRLSGHWFGFVLVFWAGALCVSANESTTRIYTEQSGSYEVVGADRRSVRFVGDLSESVEGTCRRYLADRELSYPFNILVTLNPSDQVDSGEVIQISRGDRGAVRLDIHWTDAVTLEQTCRALAQAYLLRFAYFNGGDVRAEKLPAWVVSALGTQAYVHVRPGMLVGLVEALRAQPLPPLDQVMLAPAAESSYQVSDYSGYWMMTFLKESGVSRAVLSKFLRSALVFGADTEGLQKVMRSGGPELGGMEVNEWWSAAADLIRARDYERYETLESSREWIGQLSNVAGFELANGKSLKNLKDLWRYRDEADVQAVLRARRELLVLRLGRVNPAYYNAARSLGELFEHVIEPDNMAGFISALTAFLGDYEDTKRLEQRVQAELGGDTL